MAITDFETSSASGFFREYTAPVDIDLEAGDYWISILKTHPTLDDPALGSWGESHLGLFQGGIARRQFGETDVWTHVGGAERAFELRGVPEPSTALLLVIASSVFALRWR